MRRVLLTGASGFIGRHCIEPLLTRGFSVHAVCHGPPPVDVPGATWHPADLLDINVPQALLGTVAPTHLVHLAWAFGHGGADPAPKGTCPAGYLWTQATLSLVRHFVEAGGRRAVIAGTSFEYDWTHGLCSEFQTPRRPTSLYGVCKSALSDIISSYADGVDLSSAWARIFFLYGPHEPGPRLIASVIRSLLRNQEAACSHGMQVRDYLYVQDVADALAAILDSDVKGPVNVGSQEPISLKQIINTIGERLDRSHLIRLGALPARPGDAPLVLADTTRLTSEVGWRPRFDLDAGLDRTINWWRSQLNPAPDSSTQPDHLKGVFAR